MRMKTELYDLLSLIEENDTEPSIDEDKKTLYCGEWVTSTIGIGKDHLAYITMDKESYEVLKKLGVEDAETLMEERKSYRI